MLILQQLPPFLGGRVYNKKSMPFPVKICAICSEEFELKPDKPGFANRCPSCSEPEEISPSTKGATDVFESKNEANAARRAAMKDLLYRKDS